jgi:cytochrome b
MQISDDTTPLRELRRNVVAAVAVFVAVGIGAVAFVTFFDWIH